MWSIIAALLGITACTNENEVKETANLFLETYLSADYQRAAEFCTPEFAEYFIQATSGFNNLDESVISQIKDRASKLTVEIKDINKINNSDTLNVSYSILGEKSPIKQTLQLVENNGSWKICRLNKR